VWLYDAGVCFLRHWLAAGVTLHMGWGCLFVQQVHCMCGLHSCGCCGGMWSGVAGIEVHFMSHAVCSVSLGVRSAWRRGVCWSAVWHSVGRQQQQQGCAARGDHKGAVLIHAVQCARVGAGNQWMYL